MASKSLRHCQKCSRTDVRFEHLFPTEAAEWLSFPHKRVCVYCRYGGNGQRVVVPTEATCVPALPPAGSKKKSKTMARLLKRVRQLQRDKRGGTNVQKKGGASRKRRATDVTEEDEKTEETDGTDLFGSDVDEDDEGLLIDIDEDHGHGEERDREDCEDDDDDCEDCEDCENCEDCEDREDHEDREDDDDDDEEYDDRLGFEYCDDKVASESDDDTYVYDDNGGDEGVNF